jgi:hypothetical protein
LLCVAIVHTPETCFSHAPLSFPPPLPSSHVLLPDSGFAPAVPGGVCWVLHGDRARTAAVPSPFGPVSAAGSQRTSRGLCCRGTERAGRPLVCTPPPRTAPVRVLSGRMLTTSTPCGWRRVRARSRWQGVDLSGAVGVCVVCCVLCVCRVQSPSWVVVRGSALAALCNAGLSQPKACCSPPPRPPPLHPPCWALSVICAGTHAGLRTCACWHGRARARWF